MNTKNVEQEFDYQQYAHEHGPDPALIRSSPEARKKRRDATKQRITIRIDEDIIDNFKSLVPEGKGYQKLINQALREWLIAQSVKELVRVELSDIFEKFAASFPQARRGGR